MHDIVNIDGNLEGHGEFFPLEFDDRGVRFQVVKIVGQRIVHVRGFGLHGDAQGIFGLVVGEGAPGRRIFRENDCPIIGGRDHVQAVGAFIERLAFNEHGIAERDGGVDIRAGAPDLAVRHQAVPYFAIVDERAVIVDGDVGDADSLRDFRALARQGQIENLGLRAGQHRAAQQQQHCRHQERRLQKKSIPARCVHFSPPLLRACAAFG